MKPIRIAVVGGTFDKSRGKPSKIIDQMVSVLREKPAEVWSLNGGLLESLPSAFELLSAAGHNEPEPHHFDTVLWFPNVDNSEAKVRNIKSENPTMLLVSSKRNENGKYEFMDLVAHALSLKSNLVVEFAKSSNDKTWKFRLFDPLGNVWCDYTTDIRKITEKLFTRLTYLSGVKRMGSYQAKEEASLISLSEMGKVHHVWYHEVQDFVGIVKRYADVFHDLIHPAQGVSRFLGNASFRCERGFPSFRGISDIVFVSARNVDKRNIGESNFVPCKLTDDGVLYWGCKKPSVDAPVQLMLYRHYTKVNFMLHSHVYVKDAPFTFETVPCGGLQESEEIKSIFPAHSYNFAVNLSGHGSLVFAGEVEFLKRLSYYKRPMPELKEIK